MGMRQGTRPREKRSNLSTSISAAGGKIELSAIATRGSSLMTSRRVVITGLGVVFPSGWGKKLWSALLDGNRESAIRSFDASAIHVNSRGDLRFRPEDHFRLRRRLSCEEMSVRGARQKWRLTDAHLDWSRRIQAESGVLCERVRRRVSMRPATKIDRNQ